jgi:DNA (cytosine-5)-methyltransferase 1
MRFFDMFSGIGGFHEGIHRAMPEAECIGYSDIDKKAISVYEKHFEGVKNYGDATKINPGDLPDFDLLCGGFPCQSFSIAGKRRGLQDIRGTLFVEIVRLAKAKRPRLLLLENVKGLLNHDGGETLATILDSFSELGYALEWEVINSKNFGVPQDRSRIFIIGHFGGEPTRQVFPLGNCNEAIIGDVQGSRQVSTCLDANYGKGWLDHGQRTMIAVQPFMTPDRLTNRANGRRMKENGEPSFTLSAQDRHGVCLDGVKIRRFTPLECERLQGFPDGWTEYGVKGERMSDSARYKMLGNAVTVPVIEAITKEMFKHG